MAGSFNGWINHFTLEPDLSTEIPPPGGGRGPILFSCDMRLYPGEYEVGGKLFSETLTKIPPF